MIFHPVTPESAETVLRYTSRQAYENCEPTLACMMLWRESWGIGVCEQHDTLFISMRRWDTGEPIMCQPWPLDFANAAQAADAALEEQRRLGGALRLHGVNTGFKSAVEQQTDRFSFEPKRESWEYIYSVSELIELPGRRFHQKRNHCNQFYCECRFAWHTLTPDGFGMCQAFFERWAAEKGETETIKAERTALKAAFANWDFLQLKGAWIEIGGRMAAFTVGGMINPELAVIHFEKADTTCPGIYAAMNQMFLSSAFADVPFVNRQEDLGIEGLRRAKMSYRPVRFAEKWVMG